MLDSLHFPFTQMLYLKFNWKRSIGSGEEGFCLLILLLRYHLKNGEALHLKNKLSYLSQEDELCYIWLKKNLLLNSLCPFQPNSAQSILGLRVFIFFNEAACPIFKGRWLKNSENTLTKFKNLLLNGAGRSIKKKEHP